MSSLALSADFPLSLSARATMADVPAGGRTTVEAVREPGDVGERLMEMGLTPGTAVTVLRRQFLGRNIQLRLRGFTLSVPLSLAEQIDVRAATHPTPQL